MPESTLPFTEKADDYPLLPLYLVPVRYRIVISVNALIESSQMELLDDNIEKIVTPTTNSDRPQNIFRCSECKRKVDVWSHYGAAGDVLNFIRVGTLDNPDLCPPDMHIFTSTKRAWVQLPHDVLVMAENYQRSRYWPV